MAESRNIHLRQFNALVEFSREGKPKRAHPTQAAAQVVADSHQKKYGTIATTYQGRDRQWYVTTDRRATAESQHAAKVRRQAELMADLHTPLVASDIRTREIKHVGTGRNVYEARAAMNPASSAHGAWLKWVAGHPVNRMLRGE